MNRSNVSLVACRLSLAGEPVHRLRQTDGLVAALAQPAHLFLEPAHRHAQALPWMRIRHAMVRQDAQPRIVAVRQPSRGVRQIAEGAAEESSHRVAASV